jgi:hypothetical protein
VVTTIDRTLDGLASKAKSSGRALLDAAPWAGFQTPEQEQAVEGFCPKPIRRSLKITRTGSPQPLPYRSRESPTKTKGTARHPCRRSFATTAAQDHTTRHSGVASGEIL